MQLCQLPSHGLVAAIGFLVFSAPTTVFSATLEATPSNYRKVLRSLKPGDTMVLAPGIYTHGIALANVHGTADHRITVRGPNDGSALFVADDC